MNIDREVYEKNYELLYVGVEDFKWVLFSNFSFFDFKKFDIVHRKHQDESIICEFIFTTIKPNPDDSFLTFRTIGDVRLETTYVTAPLFLKEKFFKVYKECNYVCAGKLKRILKSMKSDTKVPFWEKNIKFLQS